MKRVDTLVGKFKMNPYILKGTNWVWLNYALLLRSTGVLFDIFLKTNEHCIRSCYYKT